MTYQQSFIPDQKFSGQAGHPEEQYQLHQRKAHQPPQHEDDQSSLGPPPYRPTSTTMKKYDIVYTTSRLNARLHLGSSSGRCTYYCETSLLTPVPQLYLRIGDSKSAPMVAAAKVHYVSRHVQIGAGDSKKDMVWEEMRRQRNRLLRSDYDFDTVAGGGKRNTYGWKVEMLMTKTIYKCVDEQETVVAHMLSGGFLNWKKGGEIEIVEGLDEKLEGLLVASALAIWVAEAGWSVFQGYGKGAKGSSAQ